MPRANALLLGPPSQPAAPLETEASTVPPAPRSSVRPLSVPPASLVDEHTDPLLAWLDEQLDRLPPDEQPEQYDWLDEL